MYAWPTRFSTRRGLTFDVEKTHWTAVNQWTQAEIEVELPKAMVEGKWLAENTDSKKRTPVAEFAGPRARSGRIAE